MGLVAAPAWRVKEPHWLLRAVPPAGGNYTWGSPLQPWEIAANGQKFVQDHVRMQDVLLYIRCAPGRRDFHRSRVGGAWWHPWQWHASPTAGQRRTQPHSQSAHSFPDQQNIPPIPTRPSPPPLRRDMLKSYAALQKFKVKPHAKATCYTGDLLLQQFGTPHRVDGEIAARAYPWLKGYDGGCKEAEAVWGTYK